MDNGKSLIQAIRYGNDKKIEILLNCGDINIDANTIIDESDESD